MLNKVATFYIVAHSVTKGDMSFIRFQGYFKNLLSSWVVNPLVSLGQLFFLGRTDKETQTGEKIGKAKSRIFFTKAIIFFAFVFTEKMSLTVANTWLSFFISWRSSENAPYALRSGQFFPKPPFLAGTS